MKNKRGLFQKIEAEKLWGKRKREIIWLYNDCKWSLSKIGKYFEVSQTAMSKVIKRLNIPSRGKGRLGKENGRYVDGKQSRLYRQMIEKDKCDNCSSLSDLGIHHKNGNHFDNKLSNLVVLCGSCHSSLHKKLWWKKNKDYIKSVKREKNGTFSKRT